jgi:hypothetical protein
MVAKKKKKKEIKEEEDRMRTEDRMSIGSIM